MSYTTIINFENNNNINFDFIITLRTDMYLNNHLSNFYDTINKNLNNTVYVANSPKFSIYNQPSLPCVMFISDKETSKKILEELDISNIKVIDLIADEEELTKRLLLRAQKSGRTDDNEETIKKRFEVYDNETFPILDYYDNTGADVSDIDGIGDVDEIHQRILQDI